MVHHGQKEQEIKEVEAQMKAMDFDAHLLELAAQGGPAADKGAS